MKKIIINGANGFVASNFIAELLQLNYNVIALVRGDNFFHAEERMLDALQTLTGNYFQNSGNLDVYSYSLLQNDFSLPSRLLNKVFNEDVDYFHFAASLKFSKKTQEEIFETNVNGLENSVRLFLKYASRGSRFFFISTAYSCGKMKGTFKEVFYENKDISHFRNYYEQSKRFAENVIRRHIAQSNLRAHIIRPSQVVGDNKTGITKTDFGIFDFAKRISSIAYRYPDNTIRINATSSATQNLIPIDALVSWLMQTIEAGDLPTIMNFVAKNPIKNSLILKYLSDNLPVDITPTPDLERSSLTSLEKMIDLGMSFTGSYSNDNSVFGTENFDKVIVRAENSEITPASLQRMLHYFINNHSNEKYLLKTKIK